MPTKVEKLVLLALATENIDEAFAALRQARKLQPAGKLKANQSPDWARYERKRDELSEERKLFEAERTEYHRRILRPKEEEAAPPADTRKPKPSNSPKAPYHRIMTGYGSLTSALFGN